MEKSAHNSNFCSFGRPRKLENETPKETTMYKYRLKRHGQKKRSCSTSSSCSCSCSWTCSWLPRLIQNPQKCRGKDTSSDSTYKASSSQLVRHHSAPQACCWNSVARSYVQDGINANIANDTLDGRNPANQLRLVVSPIIYKVFVHPNGGFSTAGFLNHQLLCIFCEQKKPNTRQCPAVLSLGALEKLKSSSSLESSNLNRLFSGENSSSESSMMMAGGHGSHMINGLKNPNDRKFLKVNPSKQGQKTKQKEGHLGCRCI